MSFFKDGGVLPCLSDEEMARVMDQAGRYGKTRAEKIRWKTLMALLVNYGPRISETAALRWDMVDFERKTITFPTLKFFRRLPDGTTERVPKTRTLPLFPEVAVLLRAHRARSSGTPWVFAYLKAHSFRTVAWKAFQTMLERAGIPPVRLHILRHSAISRLAEIDPVLAQKTVGHSDLSTTSIYVHARRMQKQFEELKPILGTAIRPAWPPEQATDDPPPSPQDAAPRPQAAPAGPLPSAAPWSFPWNAPQAEPPPPGAPSPPDEDLLRRLDRIEGAFVMLVRGLAQSKRGNGHRLLPEASEPLALGPGTDAPAAPDGDGGTTAAVELPAEQEYLRLRDVAARASLSVESLRRLTQHPTHPLPHFRLAGKIIVRRSEFEAWLEHHRPQLALPPEQDPTGVLPAGDDAPSKPRFLLRDQLKPYGLDSPTEFAKVLGPGRSRQYAHQILSGKNRFGLKIAKRIGAKIGVPWTTVIEWQYNAIAAREAEEAQARGEETARPAGA